MPRTLPFADQIRSQGTAGTFTTMDLRHTDITAPPFTSLGAQLRLQMADIDDELRRIGAISVRLHVTVAVEGAHPLTELTGVNDVHDVQIYGPEDILRLLSMIPDNSGDAGINLAWVAYHAGYSIGYDAGYADAETAEWDAS